MENYTAKIVTLCINPNHNANRIITTLEVRFQESVYDEFVIKLVTGVLLCATPSRRYYVSPLQMWRQK